MKILVFGAGVLGSLYAARLQEIGIEVALVARGKRYQQLEENGIVLEEFDTGERTRTEVRLLDKMPVDEYFDTCLVFVQKTQLNPALSALRNNPHIPLFVFMNNTAEGPQEMSDVLGKGRVAMGHANAGGERDEHIVRYMISDKMVLGELSGLATERLSSLAKAFTEAGFKTEFSSNIDAWKRYHVALAVPFACAMYMNGACNIKLSKNREAINMCLEGIREAFTVLKSLGYPVEPPKLKWLFFIPDFLLAPLFQKVLKSKIADIGMARHLRNARAEMAQLQKELHQLVEKTNIDTPVLNKLCQIVD